MSIHFQLTFTSHFKLPYNSHSHSFSFFFYSHRLSSPLKKNLLNPFSFPFSSPFFQHTLPYILIPTHISSPIFLFNHNKLYFYHHTFPFVTISYHLSNSSFFKSQLVFFHIIFSFIFPQHQSPITYSIFAFCHCHSSHCHIPIPAGIAM